LLARGGVTLLDAVNERAERGTVGALRWGENRKDQN
jgi:hypothetical protein